MKPTSIQSPHRAPSDSALSREQLDRYLHRAHCLRALQFRRAFRGIARGFGRVVRGLTQARDRRRAIAELRRLDERTLNDIGIQRAQIPFIVEQLLERRAADREPGKAYPLRALTTPAARTLAEDEERCPPLAA